MPLLNNNCRVLCWDPSTGEHVQFPSARSFFRWAVDELEPSSAIDVWYVDSDNKRVVECWTYWNSELYRWELHTERLIDYDVSVADLVVAAETEPLQSPRERQAASILEECVAVAEHGVDFLSPQEWALLPPSTHHTFGYLVPAPDSTGCLVFRCCPGVIATHAAHLDEVMFQDYVNAVGTRALYEFGAVDANSNLTEAVEVADRMLQELMPDSWTVLQGVEAKVLDDAARELLG